MNIEHNVGSSAVVMLFISSYCPGVHIHRVPWRFTNVFDYEILPCAHSSTEYKWGKTDTLPEILRGPPFPSGGNQDLLLVSLTKWIKEGRRRRNREREKATWSELSWLGGQGKRALEEEWSPKCWESLLEQRKEEMVPFCHPEKQTINLQSCSMAAAI